MRADLAKKSIKDLTSGADVVRLIDIVQNKSMSNDDHIIRDIHDSLRSYYKVARKRFVDNVVQSACWHLMTGPKTPLKLFNASFISKLNEEQIEDIASEDAGRKRKRKALEKEIKDLEAGKKILNQSAKIEQEVDGA